MFNWKQQVSVQLETVTPLFLGGADPRGEPELRPPAFRGAMRYWFRAALGGVIGDQNLSGLRKLEREVFGDAEYGSPIAIQVQQKPLPSASYPVLPHKTPSGNRRAFNPQQQFEVILSTTRPVDLLVWVNACMAFNLAVWLGGLGLRSRRGAGSLQVIKSTDTSLIPVFPDNPDMFPKRIDKILRSAVGMGEKLAEQLQQPVVSLPTIPTAFPCAAQGAEIRFVKDWARTSQEALTMVMRNMPKADYLGGISPRQGSPLWVNIFYASQAYHLLLTVLPSRLISGRHNYQSVLNVLQSFGGQKIEIKGWNQ
ncbi:MAG TPA: type III-B CRISPR module RAMP protein Cmr1 [Anaerolinea thermolimosa]|uniref:Type III-B CRISPR module RAMP protein Cmr1 n=1 Tax=Anaerolinea thermolimosa TaxID=229919 RepID=A0A3D1JFQ1_9CHLR|nr:type III-B CRISPR module RAMP protein Cmr1 [Anaerolinea thermolimosa]